MLHPVPVQYQMIQINFNCCLLPAEFPFPFHPFKESKISLSLKTLKYETYKCIKSAHLTKQFGFRNIILKSIDWKNIYIFILIYMNSDLCLRCSNLHTYVKTIRIELSCGLFKSREFRKLALAELMWRVLVQMSVYRWSHKTFKWKKRDLAVIFSKFKLRIQMESLIWLICRHGFTAA